MKYAMIAAMMLANAAEAQTFQPFIDRTVVDQCFFSAPRGTVFPVCLGVAANACMQLPGGSTTPGISECLGAETAIWDAYLNQQYQVQMAQLTADQQTALRMAQRAWIAFRDAECGLMYALFIDGSIRSSIHADCLMRQTASRALTLRDLGAM